MSLHVLAQDCRSLVWNQPPSALIADLPYRRHVHEKATSCGTEGLGGGGLGVHKRDLGFAHLSPSLRRHVARTAASVKRWSVLYSDVESAWLIRIACQAAGAEYIRTLPWIRWSQPQLSGDRPPTGLELLTICHAAGERGKPLRKRWNGRGNLTDWGHECNAPEDVTLRQKCLRGEDKHKAEKPLDQMLDLVCYFSDPGEWVTDYTGGVMTTGVACALLGRSFVGCEIDPEVAARGRARVEAAEAGKLSERDAERVIRWLGSMSEAAEIPAPLKPSELRQWERAQRRLQDAQRVAGKLGLYAA